MQSLLYFLATLLFTPLLASWSAQPADISHLSATLTKPGADSRLQFAETYPALREVDLSVKSRRLDLAMPGEFPVLKNIAIHSTWGEIWSYLDGRFDALSSIKILSTTGRVFLDLRGQWHEDCLVEVETTSGKITVNVPQDVGLVVEATSDRGNVLKGHLKRKNWWNRQVWVNDKYGTHPVTLHLVLKTHAGNILIETKK